MDARDARDARDPTDPKAPVDWATLEAAGVRPEPTCRALFERHRDALEEFGTRYEAVEYLKRVATDELDASERPPDQGLVYVLAYLVEREGVAPQTEESPGALGVSLLERRPDPGAMERRFWDDERMFWWLAVEYGVHYSLVVYWFWEEDVPLMRWNIPEERWPAIDAVRETDEG